ncbi:hypothetical protein AM499_02690 [Bacillus sp. FJAT-22090]|uniref:ABC-three component system protein n=1 Tax=Bacillus sp. FJAT-22090 TaxID=1581038 RepID=UPI0006AE6DA6|nr:ABC-three component system protein [Bacillus sp. FJAT-22090]ALC84841.1 hypothetical protein AM499_02690 [Bacillus sp. FJAT-22090]
MGKVSIIIQDEKYTTDASPSWNGFNHQGRIGVLVVLTMINNLKLSLNACNSYELELEWLEDFSIKKDNDYIAIHQVKTYNKTAPSEYKEAIWLLLAKVTDFPNIKKCYLHSTSKISNLKDLETRLYEYKPPKKETKRSENEEDNEKDKNKKEDNKKYWTPRQCHDYVKSTGKYKEVFAKFEVYKYEDDCQHCNMDEVEDKIKNQLSIFYKDNIKTPEHLNRAYLHLLGLVDKHIRDRHINVQAGHKSEKATINFQKIYEIIIANYELPSKEYITYQLRERFTKLTNEYFADLILEVEDEIIDRKSIMNVNRVINSVLKLDEEEFIKFCMKITPNHEVNDENPDSLLNALSTLISETHMNDGFLEILKRIQNQIDVGKFTFIKLGPEKLNVSYLPTTIIDTYHKQRTGRIIEKILKNSNDDSLLEIDVMITKNINLPRLKPEKINSDIPDHEIDSEVDVHTEIYHNRISKIKNIRMLDIENAKGEIDE